MISPKISEINALVLHDKATRGMMLTEEEQTMLASWYTREDEAEANIINTGSDSDTLASLQAHVKSVLIQLTLGTERIQATEAENERLRREIAELRHQLANTARRSDSMSISELEEYENRIERGEIKW